MEMIEKKRTLEQFDKIVCLESSPCGNFVFVSGDIDSKTWQRSCPVLICKAYSLKHHCKEPVSEPVLTQSEYKHSEPLMGILAQSIQLEKSVIFDCLGRCLQIGNF